MDTSRFEFKKWPLDLLIDYALKMHHRMIRARGPELLELISELRDDYPNMAEVEMLFEESLSDLNDHLLKEENVLFPYLYELWNGKIARRPVAPMHCGTIANPIKVMIMEHEGETNRHQKISELTNGYLAPENASIDYKRAVEGLKEFAANLHEHIHIENDIIFPMSQEIEEKIVRKAH